MHNHQCGDLVEIFTNIARFVWTQCIPPGGNLDQLAIDLIERMITADVEWYLDTAIEMKANGHTRPIAQNPTTRHVITFEHHASGVTGPDRHHSETFIRETEQAVGDLFNLITDIKTTRRSTKQYRMDLMRTTTRIQNVRSRSRREEPHQLRHLGSRSTLHDPSTLRKSTKGTRTQSVT